MKIINRILCLLLMAGSLRAADSSLPRSTPEAQGVPSAAILQLVNGLDQIEALHGLVILRHGKVIAEGWWTPYNSEHPHVLYSLSKSFTSSAVGFAVAEGKLNIDTPVLKFFPENAPDNPGDNLKALRLRDLLTMSSGQQNEPPRTPDKMCAKSFFAQPLVYSPGTHFMYNTPATFMQSAIVQKVTGQTTLDFLQPRLFEPLGIESPVWDTNFQGICLGGYGLRLRTEDIAKFGQLYLQHGNWQGKQLLPESWITLATSREIANGANPNSDGTQGYGFQFWRCRHNAFRGDGAFGQLCVVMPDQDMVVAVNSGTRDAQSVLNLIWTNILPNVHPEALPTDDKAVKNLNDRLAHLEVRTPDGAVTSPLLAQEMNRQFAFPTNALKFENLTLLASEPDQTITLTATIAGDKVVLPCGYHAWKNSRFPMDSGKLGDFPNEPVGGAFAWTSASTCVIKLCAYETPYQETLTLKFDGHQVVVAPEFNVSFGATKLPEITGQAE